MFQLVEPGLNVREIGSFFYHVPGQPISGIDTGIVRVCVIAHEGLQCRIFYFFGLSGRERLFHGFVAAAADPLDFFHFVKSENDIAKLFIVVAGLLPDLGDADAHFAAPDQIQDGLCGALGENPHCFLPLCAGFSGTLL
jgi:hypothetical protein